MRHGGARHEASHKGWKKKNWKERLGVARPLLASAGVGFRQICPSKRWKMRCSLEKWVSGEWRRGAFFVGNIVRDGKICDKCADERDPGATMVVLDLSKTFERVCLPVVGRGTHFDFPRKVLHVPCHHYEHQPCVQFTVMKVRPPLKLKVFADITAFMDEFSVRKTC